MIVEYRLYFFSIFHPQCGVYSVQVNRYEKISKLRLKKSPNFLVNGYIFSLNKWSTYNEPSAWRSSCLLEWSNPKPQQEEENERNDWCT